ncbi:MAG: MarR family transcriptional regulator [Rikenellaceae bacterium]|nr:MarR family transcriptional regulator [Rikenellaceae bacterium]
MAIGSRLRMLTDKITEDASHIYKLYGTDMKPKWFPVFFVLSNGESGTVTEIAKEIGHTHPSVSNIIREMTAHGYIVEKKSGGRAAKCCRIIRIWKKTGKKNGRAIRGRDQCSRKHFQPVAS